MKTNRNIANLSIEELFERYKNGYQTMYFHELFRRYIPMLYGLCLKYLGNETDAQDAVMDLFEDLNQKITKYDITNFHSWLYTVAKNHCLLKIRKGKQLFFADINEEIMENGDFFTPLNEEKTNEEKEALEYCMTELGIEQRTSIEYFYYEDKSYADIVFITGYTLDKVKSYIQNGKRNLKNCIKRMLEIQ
ncbi:MAG: sigma-70 family RNA polymerase sigma factor [Petrimonas sp.]|uniref:RNA polymerase sigma factor n=1 Tax=Petrimonas sp. TaxID=2023866 RepID=UPI002B3E8A8F|nr:sigma-70 family RNA polymerase sigma factor [Petrimonas sp.]MEA4997531.1 sigma-70 family RNA polymerase sigma factor [Petrimonas sp.]MEA5045693.1 sigma-70 family RNA polymerase sigma factor [Petrimonas sp.]